MPYRTGIESWRRRSVARIEGAITYCKLIDNVPTRRNNARNGVSSMVIAIALTFGTYYGCEVCISRYVSQCEVCISRYVSQCEVCMKNGPRR